MHMVSKVVFDVVLGSFSSKLRVFLCASALCMGSSASPGNNIGSMIWS